MTTDLTFFTNEPDATLLDRFRATLRDVQFFDMHGQGPQVAQSKHEFNALVYELYELAEDEIAIVEGRA